MMKRPSHGKKKQANAAAKFATRLARAAVSEGPLGADNRRGKKQINTGALQLAESNFEVPPDKIALTS